ncbi:MAG: hypothetical protein CVU05_15305 [Bacteroidetes bacterium HGW-Bacteroidetes-21]|nr:MAG: hypothetical protein CVU05_15305 [Bacteroidetes bacterium HGW-Bacteroidetes-21]
MKQEFKRSPLLPIMLLIPALLFGFSSLLQFSMGSPVAFLTFIASILFLVNSIWSFSTPLVRLENNTLFFKEALLKQKMIDLANILSVDIINSKTLDLHMKNNTNTKIRLNSMPINDREIFIKYISEMVASLNS